MSGRSAQTLMDEHLATWHVRSRHSTRARASREATWRALQDLDMGRSRILRALLALRGLPTTALDFESMERLRFVRLAERPPEEMLIGIVGKFWTPTGHLLRLTPEEFVAFDRSGFAKAAWNFRIEPVADGEVELTTETRILCTSSSLPFRLYWLFVGPFSGWVRREMLRLVCEAAEASC